MISSDQTSPTKSRPLVAPPTLVLGGTGGAQDSPRASGFVLKPSALAAQTSNLKIYNTPTRINNNNGKPTDRLLAGEDDTTLAKSMEQKDTNAEIPCSEKSVPSKCAMAVEKRDSPVAAKKESSTDNKSESGVFKSDTDIGEVVFGQNLDNRVTNVILPKPAETSNEKEGFVFGQNLHERVANADVSEVKTESVNSSELSFAAAACEKEGSGAGIGDLDGGSDGAAKGKTGEKRTLTETAEEHQLRLENEAKKGRLDEVEVLTGEEDESNVLQINCKLYIYEEAQYQERGRGVLRVNDKQNPDDGSIQSRVVMRTQGSLRVVLNTSVWSGMKVEHPSAKSIRLTGQSPEGVIGVFLVQCISPKDADQLFHALEWRVQALKKAQQQGQQQEPSQKNKKDPVDDDDDDDDDGDREDAEEEEGEDDDEKVEVELERKLDSGSSVVDLKDESETASGKHDDRSSGEEAGNSNSNNMLHYE
ncbi:ran-binding protein 3-like isoform X2 [Varroa jacobsoni]|uniref:RanBD1 domain-containing protein n=1 Tax=Varroa destructor TaxID=109461 RepID=A0A7M7K4J5_VARDE|nr:ran-binding protein 3-like isoform X2 [Varroa destructor]XP_022691895.1 ran-binding protein 3-like isoform X2 [Varroa jacobsoni]